MKQVWPCCAAAALAGIFGCNVYRACTQSITTDEAFTYNLFLAGNVSDIFMSSFDAANHVLHTLLCKLSIYVFGLSEFTLRLPSLCGGLLYLIVVFAICYRLFGNTAGMLLSFGLLTLSPGMLDYMSASRGYGLALAFFVWALYEITERRMLRAGITAGLAVATNLSFAIPVIVLLATQIDTGMIVCATVIGGAINLAPLIHATRDRFYYGAGTLLESTESLAWLAFGHHAPRWLTSVPQLDMIGNYAAGAPLVIAAGIVTFIAAGVALFSPKDHLLRLSVGCMLGSGALLVLAHLVLGIPYPRDRTGIYLVFLFFLTLAALMKRSYGPVFIGVAALCLVQFGLQFCLSHYAEWPVSADSKQIARELTRLHDGKSGIRVGASYELEPDLNFYRQYWKLNWMEPVDLRLLASSYDYYVLQPDDAKLVDQLHLHKLYEGPLSHSIVAEPLGVGRAILPAAAFQSALLVVAPIKRVSHASN